MALSMCLAGSVITLEYETVEQSNFSEYTVARVNDASEFSARIVPCADPPTGMRSQRSRQRLQMQSHS